MNRSIPVLALGVVLVACAPHEVAGDQDAGTTDGCRVTSMSPDPVASDGSQPVSIVLADACPAGALSVSVNGVGVQVTRTDATHYAFTPPPGSPGAEPVEVACGDDTCTGAGSLTLDDSLVPAPAIEAYSPQGDSASVLSRMTVTFTHDVDPALVNASTFDIDGVSGVATYDAATRTASFTPDVALAPGLSYGCHVDGSLLAKPGDPPAAPFEWTFQTRFEEDNPFTGSASWCPAGAPTGSRELQFSGHLVDAADAPVEGTLSFTCSLFTSASFDSTSEPAWTETLPATLTNGDFSVTLGDTTASAIGDELVGQSLFLELTINGTALLPRVTLDPVPDTCP